MVDSSQSGWPHVAWIGLTDLRVEGQWESMSPTHRATGYQGWNQERYHEEPNNIRGREHCAEMNGWNPGHAHGGWNDAECHFEKPFICQEDADRKQSRFPV